MNAVLMTHARQYAGPGTLPVLLDANPCVVCHDTGFTDPQVSADFEAANPGAVALQAQRPGTIAKE